MNPIDESYLRMTFELAQCAKGQTSPNPLVGCVIVKDNQIVGKGFHAQAGKPHAEIEALHIAGEAAKGATVYINLEPCCHFGRTPPCTQALIRHGVKRVVVAIADIDERVAGKGIAALRAAGIEVEHGFLQEEARQLNEVYLKHKSTGLPFVLLKLAMSLDGKIATRTGHSQWITSETARRQAHRYRHESDAILVGIGTVLADDPMLNVRMVEKSTPHHPVRIVLDSRARLPLTSQLGQTATDIRTIVAVTSNANPAQIESLRQHSLEVWEFPATSTGQVALEPLLRRMVTDQLCSLMIEGGAQVATAFLQAGLVDKVAAVIAPILIGGDGLPGVHSLGVDTVEHALKLVNTRFEPLGTDLLVEGYLETKNVSP